MRKILPLLFLLLPSFVPAQEKQLLKLLNDELQKQVKYQFKSPRFGDDTIKVMEPFTIKEGKVLSLKIRQYQPHMDGYVEWLQEVPLEKVLTVDKDINVILRAGREDVRSVGTRYIPGEEPRVFEERTNLFFLFFYTPDNNEALSKKIRQAFAAAGYRIETEYWAD